MIPPAFFQFLVEASSRKRFQECNTYIMRRSIGFLVMLWGMSQFFSSAFSALDGAARESFQLIEASAVVSQEKVLEQR